MGGYNLAEWQCSGYNVRSSYCMAACILLILRGRGRQHAREPALAVPLMAPTPAPQHTHLRHRLRQHLHSGLRLRPDIREELLVHNSQYAETSDSCRHDRDGRDSGIGSGRDRRLRWRVRCDYYTPTSRSPGTSILQRGVTCPDCLAARELRACTGILRSFYNNKELSKASIAGQG